MKVCVMQGKDVVVSNDPDWQSEPKNALDPDTPWGSLKEMIFDEGDKAPSVIRMLRHVIWINKIRIINNAVYLYEEGVGMLKKIEESKERLCLNAFFSARVQTLIGSSAAKEVLLRLKSTPSLQLSLEELNTNPKLINLGNGVFDIMNETLEAKCFEHKFVQCLNVDFIEDATWVDCPMFEKFCRTSLLADQSKIKLLLQILGYLWSNVWGAKKAFMFIGEANCGKSVILELVKAVLGDGSVSTIPLHKLGDRFSLAVLCDKSLNLCSEIRSTPLKNLDTFKKIVSGDRLQAEFKGQPLFSFLCRTKLLFAGNSMPEIGELESSHAVISRLQFLTFPVEIPKEEQNPNLLEYLLLEKNVIFSLAIMELKSLIQNNFLFEPAEEIAEFLEDYKMQQNHLQDFIDNYCKLNAEAKTPTILLFEKYGIFCKTNCIKPYGLNQFSEYFKRTAKLKSCQFRHHGHVVRGYSGVTLAP